MQNQNNAVLNNEVDDYETKNNFPILVEKKPMQDMQVITRDFVETFAENSNKNIANKTWLVPKLQQYLPEKSISEIENFYDEIEIHLQLAEQNKQDLQNYINSGRSQNSWFADQVMKSTANMSMENVKTFVTGLDNALTNANNSLINLITRADGGIKGGQMHGFIFEQMHINDVNLKSAMAENSYIARTPAKINGKFEKGGHDIEIFNTATQQVEGKIYQAKDCQTTAETLADFQKNNGYPNQEKLAPADQYHEKFVHQIETPDGEIISDPHTYKETLETTENLRNKTFERLDYNQYSMRDYTMKIAKKTSIAALQGMFIGAGFELAKKLWNGEKINGSDVVKVSLKSGADFGLKTAIAGSLKVASEKNLLFMGKIIPKGTPAAVIANIAFVVVENLKVIGQILDGNLSIREGISLMMQTTISTIGGLIGYGYGAAAAALLVSGDLVGAVVGFVGGTIGYMLGSTVGDTIASCVQPITEVFVSTAATVFSTAEKVVGGICNAIGSAISSVASGISSIARGICSCFGF